MYTHKYAIYGVNEIKNVIIGAVCIFDMYHWTNMAAILHMYVPLHCYCSAHTDSTLVHT